MAQERLQKVLAAAGIAARRECEQIILDGRVRVNGRPVLTLPVLVDPERDEILVDDEPLRPPHKVYYLLHKPKGVHCTNFDPDGRPRAVDLLGGVRQRVFPVGRLDADSTGLLLMTNDGELAERLTHPRYGVAKTYRVHVNGDVTAEDIARLRKGVWLAEGKTHVPGARIIHRGRERSVIEITLREGRNREVRRILARLGHNARKLLRIRIGPLSLRGLGPGEWRPLTKAELQALRRLAAAGQEDGAGRQHGIPKPRRHGPAPGQPPRRAFTRGRPGAPPRAGRHPRRPRHP